MGYQVNTNQQAVMRCRRAYIQIIFFITAVATCSNAAASLEAGSAKDHDRHDALWREQCSNIQTVLKVQPGNSPHQLMAVVYPGVAWDPMWAIVALCNEAVRSFNAGPDGTKQLPPGTILNLPVFQLPQPAAAGQAGKDPTVSNDTSNSRSITEGSSMESLASTLQSDPVTAHTCGCGAEIQVTQLSSWLQIALAAYPGINPLQITALLLSLCNPHAAMAPDNQLLPGQHLVPICSSTLEASLASFAEVLRSSYMLPTVNTTASTGSAATAEASGISAHPQQEGAVCTVETLSGQGTHLRQVALWPAGAAAGAANAQQLCPWYADGCSGPTQGLQYQDVMTPCCNAHDYCYFCAYKLGWAGQSGRQACDHLMLSNFLTACDRTFQVRGWWDWKNKWHKFWCDSTAGVMFAAVWAYQELTGGVLHTYSECPGEYGPILGAADFCFYQ